MTESQNSIVQSFERMKKEAYEDTLQYLCSLEQNSGIRFHTVAEDIRSQNQFYVFYPLLFYPLFPAVPSQTVRRITLAGNLHFRYLISLDASLDGEQEPRCLLTAHVLHEAALDILHQLFDSQSKFWTYFSSYNRAFLNALERELVYHGTLTAPNDRSEIELIAGGKSAFAKAATAALATLASREDLLENLCASQDYFHIGLQFYDDVVDWKKDYMNERYSYFLGTIFQAHGIQDLAGRPPIDVMGKMVYFSRAAEVHLQLSTDYLQRARDVVQGLECPEWIKTIGYRISVVEELRRDLERIRLREQERVMRLRSSASTVSAKIREDALGERIQLAVNFLVAAQETNGYFTDFFTSAGESTNWVTGYVGCALQSSVPGLETSLRAKDALLQFRSPAGGWGYNQSIVIDCDSTSWCLKFLLASGVSLTELSKDFQAFLRHQKPNGGFCTYERSEDIAQIIRASHSDLQGWCSPQLCVSAVALEVFEQAGYDLRSSEAAQLVDSILSSQDGDGFWESYWWDGRIYGTAHAIIGLAPVEEDGVRASMRKAADWLLAVQRLDGGWNSGVEGESIPFHTALAITGLLFDHAHYATAIRRGIQWLVAHQENDGGWPSHPILRIPKPNDTAPWNSSGWERGTKGTGIIVRDQHRLFTSATVLVALTAYAKRYGEQRE